MPDVVKLQCLQVVCRHVYIHRGQSLLANNTRQMQPHPHWTNDQTSTPSANALQGFNGPRLRGANLETWGSISVCSARAYKYRGCTVPLNLRRGVVTAQNVCGSL